MGAACDRGADSRKTAIETVVDKKYFFIFQSLQLA
jgi:hypothetical protein